MGKTQWHPLFAELLKTLLRDFYEIQTEVPVGELPKRGDLLLIRRQEGPLLPFQGTWAHLTDWNVMEFKGLTDEPELIDLELLVHVGTGLSCKIAEERQTAGQPALSNSRISFWYVAPRLGDKFLGEARMRAAWEYQTGGLWRGSVWGHVVFLVSGRELPFEEDSVPLLLMQKPAAKALGQVFLGKEELLARFNKWLIALQPELWQELKVMAKSSGIIDWEKVGEVTDLTEILPFIPPERIVQALGTEQVIKAIGPAKALNQIKALLSPQEWQEFLRSETQKSNPKPDSSCSDNPTS